MKQTSAFDALHDVAMRLLSEAVASLRLSGDSTPQRAKIEVLCRLLTDGQISSERLHSFARDLDQLRTMAEESGYPCEARCIADLAERLRMRAAAFLNRYR